MNVDVKLMGMSNRPTDLAWPGSEIAVLQDKYSVSFTVDINYLSPMIWVFLGDPLAVLWWEMSKINPHWYLGDQ